MKIDPDLCTACGTCVIYCPLNAIKLKDVAEIDRNRCVDCGDCFRSANCPADAIIQNQEPWPRAIRQSMSNVMIPNPQTLIPGRGTEEMKTNDIRGIFNKGICGIGAEMGRPGVSTCWTDVEKVAMACAKVAGVKFADQNPVTLAMVDAKTGKINPEVVNERTMSAIIEMEVPRENVGALIDTLKKVSQEIDTVFSMDIIDRPENPKQKGSRPPVQKILDEHGVKYYPNGKNNLGLAKPFIP
ncbi:MAG: 4Fe-4S binding protein [Chloroflexota bacterium]